MSHVSVLVVPDLQHREGVPVDHLEALGNFIKVKRPTRIVQLGDAADMHSLSAYDRKKRAGEKARITGDLVAMADGLERLMKPWKGLKSYSPDLHILEGNHDGCSDCVGTRMYRYVEEHPELDGAVPQPLDCWEKAGWKLHHFLEPAVLDGVFYSHLFPLTSTGNVTPSSLRYGASSAMAQLKNNRVSCIAGHKPGIDTAGPIAGLNGRIRAIQAGSFYMHDEVYRGNGGNDYWRGCLMLHRVKDGNFSVTEVDLDYLLEKYAG